MKYNMKEIRTIENNIKIVKNNIIKISKDKEINNKRKIFLLEENTKELKKLERKLKSLSKWRKENFEKEQKIDTILSSEKFNDQLERIKKKYQKDIQEDIKTQLGELVLSYYKENNEDWLDQNHYQLMIFDIEDKYRFLEAKSIVEKNNSEWKKYK